MLFGWQCLQACDRGEYILVDKAKEVQRAGGLAMVLMNAPGASQNLLELSYVIPAVHLLQEDRMTVINYAVQDASPTALLEGSTVSYDQVAPEMADFSSRGPVPVANSAVMKPDVTAPGMADAGPVSGGGVGCALVVLPLLR